MEKGDISSYLLRVFMISEGMAFSQRNTGKGPGPELAACCQGVDLGRGLPPRGSGKRHRTPHYLQASARLFVVRESRAAYPAAFFSTLLPGSAKGLRRVPWSGLAPLWRAKRRDIDALLRIVLESTPAVMQRLVESVQRQEEQPACFAAHSLKGSFATIGLSDLA